MYIVSLLFQLLSMSLSKELSAYYRLFTTSHCLNKVLPTSVRNFGEREGGYEGERDGERE